MKTKTEIRKAARRALKEMGEVEIEIKLDCPDDVKYFIDEVVAGAKQHDSIPEIYDAEEQITAGIEWLLNNIINGGDVIRYVQEEERASLTELVNDGTIGGPIIGEIWIAEDETYWASNSEGNNCGAGLTREEAIERVRNCWKRRDDQ